MNWNRSHKKRGKRVPCKNIRWTWSRLIILSFLWALQRMRLHRWKDDLKLCSDFPLKEIPSLFFSPFSSANLKLKWFCDSISSHWRRAWRKKAIKLVLNIYHFICAQRKESLAHSHISSLMPIVLIYILGFSLSPPFKSSMSMWFSVV